MKSLTANLPSIIKFWMQLNVLWCSCEINVFASVAGAAGSNDLLSGGSSMTTSTMRSIGEFSVGYWKRLIDFVSCFYV